MTKVDLDVPTLCKFDPVTSGVTFNNAEISISAAPGLGISHIEGLKLLDCWPNAVGVRQILPTMNSGDNNELPAKNSRIA